jgi:hypothetical protein
VFRHHLDLLCKTYSLPKFKTHFYEIGENYAYLHEYVVYNNKLRAPRLLRIEKSYLLDLHDFLLEYVAP